MIKVKNVWAVVTENNVGSEYVHITLRTRQAARSWVKRNTVKIQPNYPKVRIVKFVRK